MQTEHAGETLVLRDAVRRHLAERAPLAWTRSRWEESRKIEGARDPVWRGLVDLGLAGLLVPEALGGAGLGMIEAGAVLEEMGRVAHPSPFLGSAIAATSAALVLGAEDLAGRFAAGDSIAALAFEASEARVAGGRLSGTAPRVSDAPVADVVLIVAGDAVFAVETDAAGVAIEAAPTIDGSRSFATLRLADTPARRLGPSAAIAPVMDRLRAALAADGLGAAQAALDAAVAYARERRQFGAPIGSFQAVAHLLVDMLHAVELARGAVHYALWSLDAAPAREAHRAALVAHAYACEALPQVGASAIQVFGGIGFTWEHDAHLWHKRLLGLEQSLGGAAASLDALARVDLD
jgi:alkylation response protein AidB-like acyl-CoA dehydrogenase